MYVLRTCPACGASWRENGLPCPDVVNEVIDEGVWRCYDCETVVAGAEAADPRGAGADGAATTPRTETATPVITTRLRQVVAFFRG